MKKSIIVLLNLGYWIVFLFLLLIFYVFIAEATKSNGTGNELRLSNWSWIMAGFAILPGILSFYSFYFFLFNRFLHRKKFLQFLGAGLLVIVLSALAGWLLWLSVATIRGDQYHLTLATFLSMTAAMCVGTFLNGMIGLVMKGFITWYGDIKTKEDLNKKNFEMELELIRSQINPHFLFNTINNIDVLIEKDTTKASAYLNKLSDMMRFMLYETKTEKIPLRTELDYITKYIDLQKIRSANSSYINYSNEGVPDGKLVAPMIFIPFIENAFKHAENKNIENAVNIRINVKSEMIIFECENHYTELKQVKPDHGGLGNDLIQKRLALLYPGKHSLDIQDQNNIYTVKLTLHTA